MRGNLVNFIGFQLGWFACVLPAAWGYPWAGPVLVLTWIGLYFRGFAKGEWPLLAVAAVLGYGFDSSLAVAGMIAFPAHAQLGAPTTLWMVALWVNLAATLRHSLAWLSRRYALASILGAAGGVLAYATGAAFGAIELAGARTLALAVIALEWAVATPLLFWLSNRMRALEGRAI